MSLEYTLESSLEPFLSHVEETKHLEREDLLAPVEVEVTFVKHDYFLPGPHLSSS